MGCKKYWVSTENKTKEGKGDFILDQQKATLNIEF